MSRLDKAWKTVTEEFKVVKVLGEGTGGQVVKAKHRV